MKHIVAQLVTDALAELPELADAAADLSIESTVERTRDASHGDFATNIAMRLAKPARKNPRELAASIVAALADDADVDSVDIAGPGFINFHLNLSAFHAELETILLQGENYGRQASRDRPKILLEFVSANPTGPLHVGHGRGASFGATVGNLLEAVGYPVHREYYVNDAGRQMDILGVSVWLRMLEKDGIAVGFPQGGYRGGYIRDIAETINTDGVTSVSAESVLSGLPADAPEGDKEAYLEALIGKARTLLGEAGFDHVRQQSLELIRDDIEDDLAEFGVTFDTWYSEQSLTKTNRIDDALEVLRKRGMLYEKDGASWFPATDFGDEKDRVVIRANGIKTYFASDIAYHFDKRERGFDHLIDILGADHHGYLARVRAGLEAMGYKGDDLEVELVQFVTLYRGGKKMQMSTRSGEFDTLRQLRAEVGNDAARFYYVSRSNDQHLDFDLDVAKSQSSDNPVYYIQYAHARIASVFRQLAEKSLKWNDTEGRNHLALLVEPQEKALMTSLSRYPELIELSANNRAPQHLVHYLRDLANDFHTYYNAHAFIVDDTMLRDARLYLISATRVVIANGLGILGVSAPEKM
ncbi:MAG: arginine--tRNA ligase [Gammaproteobacteria bacterium]|nr:arginine--tRNA ligase [Gammaproteobacteria bacterium]MBT8109563.1 arginine--tRNA ligase [Gammaproteobacteria bacterium]NND46156.1 arginine--tRNA ligase [Woeseiaceae bacterium]NNL44265.1 arginine--tRNA ligase [Woeseiaceae bacterium]